ncbi:hypothetical protein BJY52DRAFT_775 [Lactarius psammicola]|nr:hypothetical protein BJY52DRAFT_775 [Lactarius psammicola]
MMYGEGCYICRSHNLRLGEGFFSVYSKVKVSEYKCGGLGAIASLFPFAFSYSGHHPRNRYFHQRRINMRLRQRHTFASLSESLVHLMVSVPGIIVICIVFVGYRSFLSGRVCTEAAHLSSGWFACWSSDLMENGSLSMLTFTRRWYLLDPPGRR